MNNRCYMCGADCHAPRRLTCSIDCFDKAHKIIHAENALILVLKSNALQRELFGFNSPEAKILYSHIGRKKAYQLKKYRTLCLKD